MDKKDKITEQLESYTQSELESYKLTANILYTLTYIIGCLSVCIMINDALTERYLFGTLWGCMTIAALIVITPISSLLDKIKLRLEYLNKK